MAIFSALLFVSCSDDKDKSNIVSFPEMEQEILLLVNDYRSSLDLSELSSHEVIKAQAYDHCRNMAEGTVEFSHEGFSDRCRLIGEEINYSYAAENVAKGQNTAQAAFDDWIDSQGHRENIEGDFQLTGISVVMNTQDSVYYYTHIFIQTSEQ